MAHLFRSREVDRPPHHGSLDGTLSWSWSALSPVEQLALVLDSVDLDRTSCDQRLLALDAVLSDGPSALARARLLLQRASALQIQRRLADARTSGEEASALATAVGDRLLQAHVRMRLAVIASQFGEPEEAKHQLGLAGDVGSTDPSLQGLLAMAHGCMALYTGDHESYVQLTRAGLARMSPTGDDLDVVLVRTSLASALTATGDLDAAERELDAVEPTLRALGGARRLGSQEFRRATVALHRGDLERAIELLTAAAARQMEAGMTRPAAMAWNNLGWAHMEAGRHAEAQALLERALAVHRRFDDHRTEALTLTDLGVARQVAGDLPAARDRLREALALLESHPDAWVRASCRAHLAEVLAAMGEGAEARASLTEAEGCLPGARWRHAPLRVELARAHVQLRLDGAAVAEDLVRPVAADAPQIRVARRLLARARAT